MKLPLLMLLAGMNPPQEQTQASTVDRIMVAVVHGRAEDVSDVLLPDVYFAKFEGAEHWRGKLDNSNVSNVLASFGGFIKLHTVVQRSEREGQTRLIWNCADIDPPSCVTEFNFESGKLREISHWANPAVDGGSK